MTNSEGEMTPDYAAINAALNSGPKPTEMEERVARALCELRDGWRKDPTFIDRQWHLHVPDARAALEAANLCGRNAVIEECARVADAEFERVMALQKPTNDPFSMEASISHNLRMCAVLLPDVAEKIRALTTTGGK